MARPSGIGEDAALAVNDLVAEIDGVLQSYSESSSRRESTSSSMEPTSAPLPRMARQRSSASLASVNSTLPRRPIPPTPRGPRGPRTLASPTLSSPPSYSSLRLERPPLSSRRHSETPRQPLVPEAAPDPSPSTVKHTETPPRYTLKRSGTKVLRMSDAQVVSAAAVLQGTSVDMARLSQIAQLLICTLKRRPLIKGSIVYPLSFTGRMVVQAITEIITQYVRTCAQFGLDIPEAHAHYMAMSIARSFKTQLFIHEADWEDHALSAGVDEVYMFFSDGANSDKLDVPAIQGVPVEGELFVRQSPNVVSLGPQAALACVGASVQDLPSGVLAPLTRCYSPTCGLSTPPHISCYVPSCPRVGRAWNAAALRAADATDDADPGSTAAQAWVETVPAELVATLPRREIERQNAIHEMIQKEESFLKDLQLLDQYAHRLRALAQSSGVGMARTAPLAGAALESFITTVFGNYAELLTHIATFCDRLQERQREQNPIVESLGDLVVEAALEWGPAYTAYVQHYPVALHTLKREIATNARMAKFADDCRRDPAAHRHPLDNFLFRPPARLQRYHLHLESIAKYSDTESSDREQLTLATEIIDEQCKVAQAGVEAAEQRLQVDEFAARLEAKRAESEADLDLQNPQRKLLHHGVVFRRPDGFEFEWTEMEALLFDNYLVLAKRKPPTDAEGTQDTEERQVRLVYSKKPIPVALLAPSGFEEPPLSRGHLNRRLLPGDMTDMFPFTLHLPTGDPFVLYVPTAQKRAEWHQHFLSVAAQVQEQEAAHALLARTPLCFQLQVHPQPGAQVEVTCATPFFLQDQIKMLAVGTSEGVWIGMYGQPQSFNKVLHLRGVTQCAVMERFGHFIVLADRALIVYDIEALVPSRSTPTSFAPQKISGNREVLFFATGRINGRELLVYGKKRTSETSVRLLEPVDPRTRRHGDNKGLWRRRPSEMLSHFSEYKKFYVGYEATGAQFLRDTLVVYTHRGFQTYSLDSESLDLLPSVMSRDDAQAWAMLRQLESAKPLGAFYVTDTLILLCYDRLACYTDAMGRLVRLDAVFYWEGRPSRVAFVANYVLAFYESFIEVRNPLTGKLCQTLHGDSLHMLSRQDDAYKHVNALLIVEKREQISELHPTH